MNPVPAVSRSPEQFEDRLGVRRQRPTPNGVEEILELRAELAAAPSFEFAVRERVGRFAGFHHSSVAAVRRVERTPGSSRALAVVSDWIDGCRLTGLLAAAERKELRIDPVWAVAVAREVLEAITAFQRFEHHAVHGAIGPERIVIVDGRHPVLTDVALGAALEQLHADPPRYWSDFGIAVGSTCRFDDRLDLRQTGYVMAALLLGRHLRFDEAVRAPASLDDALKSCSVVAERSTIATDALRWLRRALEADEPFHSVPDALRNLSDLLQKEAGPNPRLTPLFLPAPRVTVARPALVAVMDRPRVAEEPQERPAEPAPAPSADVAPLTANVPAISSEHDLPSAPAAPRPRRLTQLSPRRAIQYSLVAATVAFVVGFAAWRFTRGPSTLSRSAAGTLAVTTTRAGITVLVDGTERGVTPLTTRLAAGAHVLELRDGAVARSMPVTIAAGATLSQYVELSAPRPALGTLRIRTQPDGLSVSVDGKAAGTSPVVLDSVTPGEHVVVIGGEGRPASQTIRVEAGEVASLVISRDVSAPIVQTGAVAVNAPFELQVFDGEHLIGTTVSGRVSLPAGVHNLNFLNPALEFGVSKRIVVAAGKVTPVSFELPKSMVALNANPWATVWLDGQQVGETPLGNIPVAVGMHQVVFRHPSLGEQRRTIAVSARSGARVSVDFTGK